MSEHDLGRISPALRPLAERLIVAGHHERQTIWDEFLARDVVHARTVHLTIEQEPAVGADIVPVNQPVGPPLPPDPPLSSPVYPARKPARSDGRVRLTRALDVEAREIEWLWAGRVPLGMMTLFAGDPKVGKSYVTLTMAAAVSCGRPLPGGEFPNRPASVVLMSAEDDPARTVLPRLKSASADLARVHIIESVVMANGHETLPSLRADIDAITAAATSLDDCRLIVVDPVSAYLAGIDDHRNAALRGALTPLQRLAERLGAAVVLVSHLTKGGSPNGKHRVLGSVAYVGACRANHLFAFDPQDPAGRRVLMLDNGGNVAPLAPTLAYAIEDRGNGPEVAWLEDPMPVTVEQALRPLPAERDHEEQAFARRESDEWLREMLSTGPVLHVEILTAGRLNGFTRDTLRRAKERIGAMSCREGFGPGSRLYWELKRTVTSASADSIGGT